MSKKENRGLYEGMYILNATLSDEARQKALEKITTGIVGIGGRVVKTFDQGRNRLAYEINGRREGYYYLLYFDVPTRKIADLLKDYQFHEDLIRFMTLRTEQVPEKIAFKSLPQ